jgi:formylglycine-generating enzyme required for sulfatase activity
MVAHTFASAARGLLAVLLSFFWTLALAQPVFIPLPAGEFAMGNADFDEAVFELPDGDPALIEDELPVHRVTIPAGVQMQSTEVTQDQWWAAMRTRPGPQTNWQRPDWAGMPVVGVSWNDAQAYVRALNRTPGAWRYRLPSEAEWEYAARAGTGGLRPFPRNQLDLHAWSLANSGDVPHPVATRLANAWGFYDLLGNAWEWVADAYRADAYAQSGNPPSLRDMPVTKRVRRGGSYHCEPHMVRPGYRAADAPDTRYSVLGFRVVREARPGLK